MGNFGIQPGKGFDMHSFTVFCAKLASFSVIMSSYCLREKWDTNAMANKAMLHLLDYSFNMYAGMLYTLSITAVAHDAYG